MKENEKHFMYKNWSEKSLKTNSYGVRNSMYQLFLNSFVMVMLRKKESDSTLNFQKMGDVIDTDTNVSWGDFSTNMLQEALQLVLVMNLKMRRKAVSKVLDKDVSAKWNKANKNMGSEWSVFAEAAQKYKGSVERKDSIGQIVVYEYVCGSSEMISVIKGIHKELDNRGEKSWLNSLTVNQVAHFFELLDDVSDLVELSGGKLDSEKEKELLLQFMNSKSVVNSNYFDERFKKIVKLNKDLKIQFINDYITEELLILNNYMDYHIKENKVVQDEWFMEKVSAVKNKVNDFCVVQELSFNFYGQMWLDLYEKINVAQQNDLFKVGVEVVSQMNLFGQRNEVQVSSLDKEDMKALIEGGDVAELHNMLCFIDAMKLANPEGYAFYKINILDYLMVQKNKSELAKIPNEKLVEFKFKKKYSEFIKVCDAQKDFYMPGIVIKKWGDNIYFGALNIDNDENDKFLRLVKSVVQELVVLEEREPLNYQGILAKEDEYLMQQDLSEKKELLAHTRMKPSLKF